MIAAEGPERKLGNVGALLEERLPQLLLSVHVRRLNSCVHWALRGEGVTLRESTPRGELAKGGTNRKECGRLAENGAYAKGEPILGSE
jgi:hypothetical protein